MGVFLMRRRPPSSTRTYTLFPFTTLFRSVPLPDAAQLGNDGNIGKFFPHLHVYGVEVIFRMVEKHDLAGPQGCKLAHQFAADRPTSARHHDPATTEGLDRKSTRLNSSN